MAIIGFEHADEARAALRAIVSDPAHGPDALTSPDTVASLLRDYLPDAAHESGLLVAAVTAGLPAALAASAAQGTDAATAIHLAAASLAARTAYTPGACEWAASELATAAGIATASEPASDRRPEMPDPAAATPTAGPWLPEPAGAEHRTAGISQPRPHAAEPTAVVPARWRDWKRLALTLGAVVLVLAATAGAGAAYVYSRRTPAPAAGPRHPAAPAPVPRAAKPPCARGPVSRALAAANPQLKSRSWHLVSYTCQGGWAVAAIYAPSVGHGEAFLLRAASEWISDPINGGIYHCSDLPAAFVAPVPPQELAEQLFRKVGLCRAQ